MSTVQRITGYNSGLDVDSIVTKTMKPYKTKVDTEVQKKKALEYQQEQYQQIMSDASDFYDKYLDILKTGSLMSTATYQTEKYTSTDSSKVTAKGLAGASVDNYTVSVSQLASKANESIDIGSYLSGALTKNATMDIGNVQINFDVTPNGYTTVANYNKAIQTKRDDLNKTITNAASTDAQKKAAQLLLNDLDSNVIKAQYSEFNSSVSFTASQFGQGGFTLNKGTADQKVAVDKYLEATISNGSGKVYAITQSDKKTSNLLTIDNIQFDFKALSTQASTSTVTRTAPTDDLVKATALTEAGTLGAKATLLTNLQDLAEEPNLTSLTALADDASTTIASDGTKTTTNGTKTTITAKDGTVTTKEVVGSKTTTTVKSTDGSVTTTEEDKVVSGAITTTTTKTTTITPATASSAGTTRNINSVKIEDSGTKTTTSTTTTTDKLANGVITTIKSDSDGTTTTTTKEGSVITTEITIPYDGSTPISKKIVKDASVSPNKTTTTMNLILGNRTTTIESINDGTNTTTTTVAKQVLGDKSTAMTTTKEVKVNATSAIASTTSTTTNLKVDASGKTIKSVQTDTNDISVINYNSTSLTGETDVTAIKDKLVKFVDDYNTFIKSISTKLYEKRERDYMPLTDEQKKDMSDSQITAWEKKAKAGWLRNDSDLSRIAGEMKSAMTAFMSDSGLSLEAIGITPVKDYAEKNGTFTVDEEKLTKALEENAGAVKDLFIKSASGTDNGGALTRLKDTIKSEFKSSYSSLSQKAGLAGSSTEKDNTLTKSISDKKTLIDELNKKLADKENALYKKYSALETAMQTLNSQQASLTNMLGGSN